MPQEPEFFMGGGGLFSTAPDYMAFLQMLLNDGTFNGAQVLQPETVAQMRQNQIGDLKVGDAEDGPARACRRMPTSSRAWSTIGACRFDINTEPGPHGRNAGSLCWAGLVNTYFWIDPKARSPA